MILSKAVIFASILMTMISAISALPGIIRERHVIHAPIKIKTIHHYKVKKIPLIIRKHVHYYKPREEAHLKPALDDHHPNQVFQEEEEDEGHYGHHGYPSQHKAPPEEEEESSEDSHEAPEEDYEEASHSREEDYENDEYE